MNLQENIKRILREETNKILYSAVVLDKDSRDELLDKLDKYISSDWKKVKQFKIKGEVKNITT